MRKTLIACLVTAMAVGAGTATAAKFITSADIKDGTIQSKDLSKALNNQQKSSATRIANLERSVRSLGGKVGTVGATSVSSKGDNGPKGDRGDAGAKGDKGENGGQGPKGDPGPGVSGYEVKTYDYIEGGARPGHDGEGSGYGGVGTGAVATVACSAGKVAVGGGYFFRKGNDDSAAYNTSDWAFGSPAGTDGTAVIASFPGRMDWSTTTIKPGDNTGWIVQVNSESAQAHDLTAYVVCVNAN